MQFLYETPEFYTKTRNLDILDQWEHYSAWYLSKVKDKPYDDMRAFLHWAVENKKTDFTDPIMKIFRRDENGDRYKDTCTLSAYLQEVKDEAYIMAPTLTSYDPIKKRRSELSIYTEDKFYERKRVKKEGQVAKSYGRMAEATTKNNVQNKLKEDINSISGLLTIGSTPLANRSGHSTLTSVCRTATAFTNANTERVFMGRRHFFSGPTVLENITVILADSDYEQAEKIINKYNLHLVTHEELMEAIKYNTDTYYKSKVWDERIWEFVKTLTPLECTIYLYTGDLYHLRKYNEKFVRDLFDRILAFKESLPKTTDETKSIIKEVDEFFMPLASVACYEFLDGKALPDKIHEDKDYYTTLGGRIEYINERFREITDYLKCFILNKFIPAETAHFPSVIRYSVVGGDTDSVLYTVKQWVEWYNGTIEVNNTTRLTGSLCVYLINIVTRHFLAYAAGQMGVDEKFIHNLKMKSEYYFDVFAPTNRTKHYLSIASIQEGIMLKEYEEEIKGVALKNSKAPPDVINLFHDQAIAILEAVSKGEMISVNDFIYKMAVEEARIYRSIMLGESTFLSSCTVKVKEAYTTPMSSEYLYYEFWQTIFSEKYGDCPEPPYIGTRIKMNLPNPSAIKAFIDSIRDKDVQMKFRRFMDDNNKKAIASVIMPADVIANVGIPEEFRGALNVRKMIHACMEPFYILLEVMGNYKINRWFTNMALDAHVELIDERFRSSWTDDRDDVLESIRRASRGQKEEYETWDAKAWIDEDDDEEESEETEVNLLEG